ncbi:GH32 C-terminal domain-containing protein [Leifsonia sp. 2TAF2]|uniref:GH32 C-terminal domain-containing protein n=1 Tax=Leifsonia sp. 2TAF2 TaxID=3233009 RepID=UPI003F982455
MTRFYKPVGARLGDTIPFFWDGVFHVFFLKRFADDTHDRVETDWCHISTTDFVEFEDHGVAIPRGTASDPDFSAATGSVVRVGDEFHAYYTGFRKWDGSSEGRHQTVLRARSTDLVAWTKDPGFALVSDEKHFNADEWRDPFVFFDTDAQRYRMLVASQTLTGPSLRRGASVLAESETTDSWTIDPEPFWAPGIFSMHECPDLFRMGDWWYLVYSTLTDRTVTRYRMSRSLEGPWVSPADDELDGLGLYAAKTISDGDRRYLVGWGTNNIAGQDGAGWLWGGNLIVHELVQEADGTLSVRQPEITRAVQESRAESRIPIAATQVGSAHEFATTTLLQMPHAGLVDLTLSAEPETKAFGIELRATAERDHGYSVTFEPELRRVVVDRLDRFGADRPYDIRPYSGATQVRLNVEFDGELYLIYINGEQAITLRGYDRTGTELGVFASEGEIVVSDAELIVTQKDEEVQR